MIAAERLHFYLRIVPAVVAMSVLLIVSSGCGRPTDIFDPIIIGEATAEPTVLDTPASTPTDLPATIQSATATPLPITQSPTAAPTRTLSATQLPATQAAATRATPVRQSTPGSGTAIATRRVAIAVPLPGGATPQQPAVSTATHIPPTGTSTTIFRQYLAQIVSQLEEAQVATASPIAAPIVLTPTSIPPTATPTGLPTNTPTPFSGSIRLLERDPIYEEDLVPVIAYAENDSRIGKSWSSFYQSQPRSSDQIRIYASDSARRYDPVLALTSTDQWAEGVCMVSSTMVGVQFWGDENDGWARVLVDGTERWRGNTYGRAPNLFIRFLEIRDLPAAPHVVRIEPVGQTGTTLPGGNIHVSVYAVICGLPVRSEIFLPILQR